MEKQKRWHLYLILTVIFLTLVNILPTVFYYVQPLKESIDPSKAETIVQQIETRVNVLEEDAKAWLSSFSKNLGLKPTAITLKQEDPGIFEVSFQQPEEARLFKRFLVEAGASIPFVPAQLSLSPNQEVNSNQVLVSRQIHIQLTPEERHHFFHFYPKWDNQHLGETFRNTIYDRVVELALALGGTTPSASQIQTIVQDPNSNGNKDFTLEISREIVDYNQVFGKDSPITKRYFSGLLQIDSKQRSSMLQSLTNRMNSLKVDLEKQKALLAKESKQAEEEGRFSETSTQLRLDSLNKQITLLTQAAEILKANESLIQKGQPPLSLAQIRNTLKENGKQSDALYQNFDLQGRHPFIEKLTIDWGNNKIFVQLHRELETLRKAQNPSEDEAQRSQKINQFIVNEIARLSRATEETILPQGNDFAIALTQLENPNSFLAFNLGFLAEKQSKNIISQLSSDWRPEHSDLTADLYPIVDYEKFQKLDSSAQKLGLVIYAPAMYEETPYQGFRRSSIYVIARGLDAVVQKYRETPNAPEAALLSGDVEKLANLLKQKGFIGYTGSSYGIDPKFAQDYIFEWDDFYTMLLGATRENFYVKGSKRHAVLDFTDVEQRIIALNQIDDRIQEDLLKWRDAYQSAKVDLDLTKRYTIPAPTKNAFWENCKLSFAKYFRGDDRKIIRWGLDLSGGKTVRIGLRDQNNKVVTDPEELKQAVNELYTRINKMGIAERTIRVENENMILDFPGSQAFSAAELVKASAMYFHIVNEKFSSMNGNLKEAVQKFSQNVWNEAVVSNRKNAQGVNEIAWEHLGGNLQTGEQGEPRNEAAKILYDQGLRLANPQNQIRSSAFDDTLSSLALMRGDDVSEWHGQTTPLLIVFHNYALEGSSLSNVQVGYDPSEGYILNFSVKSAYDHPTKRQSGPRDDFYAWTSQFSEDKIAGTAKEVYTQGRGWRMAVILNQTVITQPSLRAALRDSASISGRFTQREISQLAADLKAGSLSFTPTILSEQNVSAELGKEERFRGIAASITGLILVAALMIGYYRFAGVVATCAVLFNLLIMWGVLQNLGAVLTLPGIAGIVLTIGMAVDANVLVFERTREEFNISGRLASAIQAGYRKAFSAIVDSNITTIIAALILIQFDSGPIKGFALTLIVGLISSMFTALFMTRYFFARWVKNQKNRPLSMAEWVKDTRIDFLSYKKIAVGASLIVMVATGFLFFSEKKAMLGMDFTGGYSLALELKPSSDANKNYRKDALAALIQKGAAPSDVEVRELSSPNKLRIHLGLNLEQEGGPFYHLNKTVEEDEVEYSYQKDPKIAWVVNALNDAGLIIEQSQLPELDNQWSMMSGQFSNAMRNNALIALGCALLSILLYITFRFEFNYALSAVIALAHDVLITLGLLALFRKMGFAVQIDLQVVGAIMTLIGYSLNDTIIVFDRIREDVKILRKLKFNQVINHALNVTLSRTLMTSGTTLIVLLPLVFMGGQSIFAFSLVMTIGVFVGTFSSLFIASPILLYLHNREQNRLTIHPNKA